jgi:signal transduction histidine kinase/CheY-like chemotaxis protein
MVEDVELELPEGKRAPLAVWGTPIRNEDGAVRYAIVAFQDITEQRAAAATRASLETQLHQAQRLESIGRLAGGVAHDFNNLLTPILAYSELAAELLPLESPIRSYAIQIRDAAVQAAELTKQLLAVGRKQALEPRVLDLNHELQEFAKMLRRLVRENVELELRLAPKLGRVRADAAQLQRVFINLALNAGDAMPEGGRLTVETLNLPDSDALPSGPCVAFRVIDTGHGMSEATLARIFEPFFTTKGPGKGTGLGLATVHGIVAQHGGQLFVHSERDRGTTFEVRLPRADEHVERVDAAESGPTDARKGHGEVILVVEDDPAVRRVIEDVLVREDYQVVATGEPLEALRLARALGDRLDLVVTDIVMPQMSGPQVLAELRRERPEISALLVSGYAEELTAAEATVPPGCALLRKPLAVDALRAHVRQLLERRVAVRQPANTAGRS